MDVPEHLRKYVTVLLARWLGRDVGPKAQIPVLLLVMLCDSAVAASFIVSLLPDAEAIMDEAQRNLERKIGIQASQEALARVFLNENHTPIPFLDRVLLDSLYAAVETAYGNNRTPLEG